MEGNQKKLNVLFLCTGNSCRSQMAEGWARALLVDRVEAFSAGTRAQGLNPVAVKAMARLGVDISGHSSKSVAELELDRFDLVVTVCDNARDNCPTFPGRAKVIHHAFDDPPALAEGAGSDAEALGYYLRVCSEIRAWVADLPERNKIDPAVPRNLDPQVPPPSGR